jgi:sulfate adenylyltransferase
MSLVPPYGPKAELMPRLADRTLRSDLLRYAAGLPRLPLSPREAADLEMFGLGAYTPLAGFMGEADWRGVLERMQLQDGTFWPIPITLSVTPTAAMALSPGHDAALAGPDGTLLGILAVAEIWRPDPLAECQAVFGTTDPNHPGVAGVLAQPPYNVAGAVTVLTEGPVRRRFGALSATPAEIRALFAARGWTTVVAFQTRNPLHRSHEYLCRIALELADGLFIHQVLGQLKAGDLPAEVRVRAVDALVRHYLPTERVVVAGYPAAMRYAGPREALLHAVVRQNFGASHLIVGRDHAGVGRYYGPYDAQRIFAQVPPGTFAIRPLFFDWTFYCRRCGTVASLRTCPHPAGERLVISGTELRRRLEQGEPVPETFSRPEVLAILREYYRSARTEADPKPPLHPCG